MTLWDSCFCVTYLSNYKFVFTSCNTHSLALTHQLCVETSAEQITELEIYTHKSEVEVNKHVLF